MSALSRPRKRTALGGLALLLALTGSAVAVGNTFGSTPAAADELLPAFDDCDALTARMRDLAAPYVGRYSSEDEGREATAERALPPSMGAPAAGSPVAPQAAAEADGAGSALSSKSADSSGLFSGSDAADAVGPGATGTNLQEAGVDEPDVAKTDGRLVVSLDGGRLRVVDVSTDRPEARGTLDLAAAGINPSELLLDGDRVLVIGTSSGYQGRYDDSYAGSGGAEPGFAPESDLRIARPYGGQAALALVDIGDPGSPRLLASEEITGRHVSARLSGGVARMVVTSTPDLRFRSGYGAGSTTDTYNSDVLRLAKAEDWLPSRTITDGSGRIVAPAAPLVDCTDVRYPAADSGMDLLSVVTLDLGRDDALSAASTTAVVTAGELVYASPDRLYVATTQGGWGAASTDRRFAAPRDGIRTAVHEFDISRPAGTEYLSSGSVSGYIPGRWALSEFEGDLRVVTTTQEPWRSDGFSAGQTESHVVVLTPRRGRLAEIGRVGGLGHGETVRAVRWFDELAAVVTFRQTDPLYLVDLAVPDRPVLRGELKVPGYSAYLHPIGDHRLLGVGQDATDTGRETGLQISSFDIADATDPRRVDTVGYGQGSSSPVQEDARGFVYLPERRTAVLPALIPEMDRGCGSFGGECGYATGLVSVRVDSDGRLAKAGAWQTLDAPGWRRSPVHKVLSLPGGRLAALDSVGVTVLDADDLDPRGSVAYPGEPAK